MALKKGVHKWAVKHILLQWKSIRSIGVTTKINDEWIADGVGKNGEYKWCDSDTSYFEGYDSIPDWKENEIVEVILDLNESMVTYYKIKEDHDDKIIIHKVKKDKLTPNQTYYFALCIDADKRCGAFECVLPRITQYMESWKEDDRQNNKFWLPKNQQAL